MPKLGARDLRAIGILLVCMALVAAYNSGWLEDWKAVRSRIAQLRAQQDRLVMNPADQASLIAAVPAFEMPQTEDKQRLAFRTRFNEQLKKAGIGPKALKYPGKPKDQRELGVRLLRLQCASHCKLSQVLDLLAHLNENPYLVSVEDFKITIDEKKREEVELDMKVSTYVRKRKESP